MNDDWDMDELQQDVQDMQKEHARQYNDAEHEAQMHAYYGRSPEYWSGHLWLWRIAMLVGIALLVWAAFTDEKVTNVTPPPAAPTTVIVTR
jgi:hypothetical protein